ncbi:hypothetical protein J3359_15305 [Polaribacter cellanae]|uniref:TonB C-terminal domain-containing protein n=2 Tax=Polaribacter cellanae TaxID=2818493 RepID=A0A975HAK7_9FLAO|nr:hypothetical protein J3359_15305 [Polaribacter cellanae]
MFLRNFSFLILILFCISCDKLSFKKKANKQVLDTVVNFSSVDTYPSFKVCDSLIEKAQQEDCFRNTIHKKIGEELQKYEFAIKDSIFEVVIVNLLINSNGNIELETIESSEIIKQELPKLDSILKISIQQIPTIYPAIKRGIPVTTKYRLPIQIQLKE